MLSDRSKQQERRKDILPFYRSVQPVAHCSPARPDNNDHSHHPMTPNLTVHSAMKFVVTLLAPLALLALTSCSTHHAPPPKVGPAPTEGSSSFGGEVVVNSATATATVVSIDSSQRQIVLKRADGRLAQCRARPGVMAFGGIKVGDTVTIGVAEEMELFAGSAGVPATTAQNPAKNRVRLPDGVKALAEAVEVLTYTGKIVAIDDWNDAVTLQLAGGETRKIRIKESVNLADFTPGDNVSARITEAIALIVQNQSPQ
jgi:hypothetical protein